MNIKELLEKHKILDDVINSKMDYPLPKREIIHSKLTAISNEVSELEKELESVWKYWKKKKTYDIEKTKVELVDILFCWCAMANELGYTPEELEEAYLDKWQENIDRQKRGY